MQSEGHPSRSPSLPRVRVTTRGQKEVGCTMDLVMSETRVREEGLGLSVVVHEAAVLGPQCDASGLYRWIGCTNAIYIHSACPPVARLCFDLSFSRAPGALHTARSAQRCVDAVPPCLFDPSWTHTCAMQTKRQGGTTMGDTRTAVAHVRVHTQGQRGPAEEPYLGRGWRTAVVSIKVCVLLL